ncbi:MAG TPA: hypothetical protein VGL29_12110 [Blastocatellia bacterium]|jgi:hypothetical protein
MKSTSRKTAVALCAFALAAVSGSPVLAGDLQGKDQTKIKQESASEGEQKAMAAIAAAPDAAAKLQAATEFIKKYPKSTSRAKVVTFVAQEANKTTDNSQRITQLENLLNVFKEPADLDVIQPILIDAYAKAERPDDVFRVASTYLAKNGNDLAVLTQVSLVGVDQAKRNNPKFVQQSQQYGAKAIELIESGKKPEAFDDSKWGEYQTQWLPVLYQSLAMVAFMSGNKADARVKIDKALSLNGTDAFSQALLGMVVDDEYQQLAQKYKMLAAGPMKDSVLQQALAKMDEEIQILARVVALSEGKPGLQQLHDRQLQDLTAYYKYRHNGSDGGLQQLIDKYKKQ